MWIITLVPVKLWLDDARTPPDASFTWVKTLKKRSFSWRLGACPKQPSTMILGQDADGNELPEGRPVYWMAENNRWPSEAIIVHSADVVGVAYMSGMIERYGPVSRVGMSTRFLRAPNADQPSTSPVKSPAFGTLMAR